MTSPLTLDVLGCARCGGIHYGIKFQPLSRSVHTDSVDYTYWADCPVSHQPILCAVIGDNGKQIVVGTDAQTQKG